MNRKVLIGLIAGTTMCLTLAGAAMPAGAQSSDPGTAAPSSASAAAEQVGTAFTFQGQLKKDGGAFNGACSFRFTLFRTATGEGQEGNPLTVDATVINGLFSTQLDFGNHFVGAAMWLETAVKCDGDADFIPQSPRLSLAASPYAIGLVPGASIRGSNSDRSLFEVDNRSGNGIFGIGTVVGVQGNGSAGSLAGVWGYGDKSGVTGNGNNGPGVIGESSNFQGVVGKSHNQFSAGVQGENDGNGPGVRGHSNGNAGVWGTSDGAYGVYGQSADNIAVKGTSTNYIGVYGESTNSAGLYGFSAQYDGVIGRTTNPARYAVYADGKVAITGGTDIAERFSSAGEQIIEPGTVVVVDEVHPGQINRSDSAYARTVVGIVSGAGGVEPGLILHQKGMMEGPHVIAITGRVYVKASAANGAIKPGDLLTTSEVPGHAMKATDRELAFGAIVGKALTGLDSDTGLVLVLVNLQ